MKLAATILAGAAAIALAGVAAAEEPIALTDAQMDTVTAGDAGALVFLSAFSSNGSSSTSATASLSVDAVPPFQSADAFISSGTTVFSGSVFLNQQASSFADTN